MIKNKINFFKSLQFDDIASNWWDINGVSKFLHLMNPIRTKYIIDTCQGIFKKKILDVGCGAGILSESLYYSGGIVTGLDVSSKMIYEAQMHAKIKNINIKYINENILQHCIKNSKYYDVVVCMEVLEHVECPIEMVHLCSKLVKPGGNLFFSTINRTLKSFFTIIFLAEYLFRFIPLKTHSFSKLITPSELLSWIDCTNLNIKDIVGIKYNPFIKKFYLSSDISTNYIVNACLS